MITNICFYIVWYFWFGWRDARINNESWRWLTCLLLLSFARDIVRPLSHWCKLYKRIVSQYVYHLGPINRMMGIIFWASEPPWIHVQEPSDNFIKNCRDICVWMIKMIIPNLYLSCFIGREYSRVCNCNYFVYEFSKPRSFETEG